MDGKLRICLDPRDLNKTIRREHYPLPTIEDVATWLYGAKMFTVLDVRKGVWHVQLSWTMIHRTSPHSTPHSDGTCGNGCPLVFALHWRCFGGGCTNSLRVSVESMS